MKRSSSDILVNTKAQIRALKTEISQTYMVGAKGDHSLKKIKEMASERINKIENDINIGLKEYVKTNLSHSTTVMGNPFYRKQSVKNQTNSSSAYDPSINQKRNVFFVILK